MTEAGYERLSRAQGGRRKESGHRLILLSQQLLLTDLVFKRRQLL